MKFIGKWQLATKNDDAVRQIKARDKMILKMKEFLENQK